MSTPLDRLNARVDWELFRVDLEGHLDYRCGPQGGRTPWCPVLMLKVIVLQKYYGLSEEATEFQILDRFSFQRFLGLDVGDDVPDKNAIWVFKERLGKEGLLGCFDLFDEVLRETGLLASRGKIVDARWAKKNAENHYGYKNHIKCSAKTKLIEAYTVTDASVHDSQPLVDLLEKGDGRLHADSAYRSEKIDKELRRGSIQNYIHQKGYRNRPLTQKQKESNMKRSKIRARVEHIFGFQVHQMRANWIRTIGRKRAERGIGLGNLVYVYNLFRYVQLGGSMV